MAEAGNSSRQSMASGLARSIMHAMNDKRHQASGGDLGRLHRLGSVMSTPRDGLAAGVLVPRAWHMSRRTNVVSHGDQQNMYKAT